MAADNNKDMMHGEPWLFTTLSEIVGDGVTLSDRTGCFAIYNAKMEEITGYTVEEAATLDDYLTLLYHDTTGRGKAMPEVHEIFHRECRDRKTVLRAKDGISKTVLVSTSPLEYQGGLFLLHAYRDITFLKTAEENLLKAEKRHRALCEQLFDALVVLEPDTFLPVSFNDRAPAFFGYTKEEFPRIEINTLETRGIFGHKGLSDKPILADKRNDYETEICTKNAEIKSVKVSARVVEQSGKRLLQCVFHELTDGERAVIKKDNWAVEARNTPDKIGTIKGIITICHVCRQIYDGKGFWRPMESSISERSDVLFSYELCPDCEEKFYPEPLSNHKKEGE
jgi:PAS domain S-box-containing protein